MSKNVTTQVMRYLPDANREFFMTNKNGVYLKTPTTLCNLSTDQGLFFVENKESMDHDLLLSSLDETVTAYDCEYNLAQHNFPGAVFPKGLKYVSYVQTNPIPTIEYSMGPIELKKELMISRDYDSLLVRYSLSSSSPSVEFNIAPMVAFRSKSEKQLAEDDTNFNVETVPNGLFIKNNRIQRELFIQLSQSCQTDMTKEWFFNFEYESWSENKAEREDLLMPGNLKFTLESGSECIVSVSLNQHDPDILKMWFEKEMNSYESKLNPTKRNKQVPSLA